MFDGDQFIYWPTVPKFWEIKELLQLVQLCIYRVFAKFRTEGKRIAILMNFNSPFLKDRIYVNLYLSSDIFKILSKKRLEDNIKRISEGKLPQGHYPSYQHYLKDLVPNTPGIELHALFKKPTAAKKFAKELQFIRKMAGKVPKFIPDPYLYPSTWVSDALEYSLVCYGRFITTMTNDKDPYSRSALELLLKSDDDHLKANFHTALNLMGVAKGAIKAIAVHSDGGETYIVKNINPHYRAIDYDTLEKVRIQNYEGRKLIMLAILLSKPRVIMFHTKKIADDYGLEFCGSFVYKDIFSHIREGKIKKRRVTSNLIRMAKSDDKLYGYSDFKDLMKVVQYLGSCFPWHG
jgi:hypothetical protein